MSFGSQSVTSLLVVSQTAGVLAVPVVAERLDRKRESLVVCGALSSLGAVGLLAEPAVVLLLVAPVMLVGFGMGGLSPLIRAIPVELDGIGPGLTGTAVGMIFAVYEINPVALFVEDVVDLIEDARSREGLERYLALRQARREELVGKRGTTEDEQEREYIDQSISMVDTSIATAEQAINLYDDVDALSRSE